MFLGEYHVKFTSPGRLVLPKKFRHKLQEEIVVLSRGLEGCIWGFSREGWEKEAEKQLGLPVIERQSRDLRRYFFSAAEEVELDGQGRFVVPKLLLYYAGLKEDAVIIGAGDHFEIWNPQNWQKLITGLVKKR